MKNLIIIVIAGFTIFFLSYVLDRESVPTFDENQEKIAEEIEMELPDFSFVDLNNKKHTIEDFQGKMVILNFWASWCTPCLEEFPEILKVLKSYKKDLVLIAISNDTSKKDIKKFLFKFKEKLAPLRSNIVIGLDFKREISSSFNILKLPETFILNKKGKIIKKITGSDQWRGGGLIQYFHKKMSLD